jgi:hypothetical protein
VAMVKQGRLLDQEEYDFEKQSLTFVCTAGAIWTLPFVAGGGGASGTTPVVSVSGSDGVTICEGSPSEVMVHFSACHSRRLENEDATHKYSLRGVNRLSDLYSLARVGERCGGVATLGSEPPLTIIVRNSSTSAPVGFEATQPRQTRQ